MKCTDKNLSKKGVVMNNAVKSTSKFNSVLYFLYLLIFIAAGFATYYFVKSYYGTKDFYTVQFFCYASVIFILDAFALIFPFAASYNIIIDEKYMTYTWIFAPLRKKFLLDEIEGYYTILLPSRDNVYLTAYPQKNGRLLSSISTFYVDNYDEVIAALNKPHLGRLNFSWRTYFVDILIKKEIPAHK